MAKLYLCPTPIGNMEDVTIRTINTLKAVHTICAEDTRHSQGFLQKFDISKPLMSYHEHNKYSRIPDIIKLLDNGYDVALISDAGTPAISDPGEVLVKECIALGYDVVPLPGACAMITGLIASGMSTEAFVFEGFLPRDKKRRRDVLARNKNETRTIIFYEAPHRVTSTLKVFLEIFGDREISICRELTKIHEEITYTTIGNAIEKYEDKNVRGEFVLVLRGQNRELLIQKKIEEFEKLKLDEHMNIYVSKGMNSKDAMKMVAKDRGISKRDVYKQLYCE